MEQLWRESGKVFVIFLRRCSSRSETKQETRNIIVINMEKNSAAILSLVYKEDIKLGAILLRVEDSSTNNSYLQRFFR